MNEDNTNLDTDNADADQDQVQDGEEESSQDETTSEGTETEGSEAEGQEGNEQSAEGSDQEADPRKSNKRSAQQRISNRIRKLKGDLNQSETGNHQLQNDLAIANQRIEILQLANKQKGDPSIPVEPSPDDFEDGVQDPKYIKKFQAYLKDQNRQDIQQEFEKHTKNHQQSTDTGNLQRDTERKQRDHYRRAIKGNNDYEVKEDALREIIGTEAIKDIISNFDDSDKIIYQLGADEDMAFQVADAMESKNHVLAVRLLERASKGLKVKPKNKTTPDPDLELEGGSPGKSKHAGRGPKGATFT